MAGIEEKKKIVAELEEKFKSSKSAIFTEYRGLTVEDANSFRRACREAGVEFRVVKNTLTRLAVERSGFKELSSLLTGPTAVAFGFEDPVAPAKVIFDFLKTKRSLEVKGGLVEGRIVGVSEIKSLADLPGRDVLLARVVGGLNGPLAGFVTVLQGPIRKLVYALNAVKDQKAAG
ncbi:MAG: large subunit ribosomal protein [Clostridia bacterium]|jgi:large subunit ribosomal protein L10|uniref:Large ribosomal subunit protein uL10 n=1 Tax=Thermacetogenium phaeum TaxID=85874 RepID=A0A117LBB0_9THEO|nr:MAG: 50S ribosomal protein L10 [Thermacetogenium phaeum]MDK2881267.1 large subunit ribosomal protein [Clostridia bacterium]